MKSKLLAIGLFVVFAASAACAATLTGKVTRVSDGDTIWVTDNRGIRHKIRMDRIDAPESGQEYGAEATAYLKRRIFDKTVQVDWEKHDRYGRVLGIVFLGKDDINLEMVKTGNAWHYSYHDQTAAFADAEKSARAAKLGLWKANNPINPYEFRKAHRQ